MARPAALRWPLGAARAAPLPALRRGPHRRAHRQQAHLQQAHLKWAHRQRAHRQQAKTQPRAHRQQAKTQPRAKTRRRARTQVQAKTRRRAWGRALARAQLLPEARPVGFRLRPVRARPVRAQLARARPVRARLARARPVRRLAALCARPVRRLAALCARARAEAPRTRPRDAARLAGEAEAGADRMAWPRDAEGEAAWMWADARTGLPDGGRSVRLTPGGPGLRVLSCLLTRRSRTCGAKPNTDISSRPLRTISNAVTPWPENLSGTNPRPASWL